MAEKVKAIKLADGTVTNLVDKKTKLSVNYRPVTTYYDGSAMTNAKVDGDLYIKNGTTFYRKVIDKDGQLFLEKDTMAQMRALTAFEILLLKAGVYKGVKLNGYYTKNDTPAPIEYYLSDTSAIDDEGSVITVGDIKLEHTFIGYINVLYFGIKGDYVTAQPYTDNYNNLVKLRGYLDRLVAVADSVSYQYSVIFPKLSNNKMGYGCSGRVSFGGGYDIIMEAPLIYTGDDNSKGEFLSVGNYSDTQRIFSYNRNYKLHVRNKSIVWNNNEFIGVRVNNMVRGTLDIVESYGFDIGVQLKGHNAGFAYTNLFIGNLLNNRVNLDLISYSPLGDSSGYITSLIGHNYGRIGNNDAVALQPYDRVGIRIGIEGSAGYTPESITFLYGIIEGLIYTTTPEQYKGIPVLINRGDLNKFDNFRHEGNFRSTEKPTFIKVIIGQSNTANLTVAVPIGTTGESSYKDVEFLDDQSIVKLGNMVTSRRSLNQKESLLKDSVVYDSGLFSKNIVPYDSANRYNVRNFGRVNSSGSGFRDLVPNSIPQIPNIDSEGYLNIPSGLGVFFEIDTQSLKHFAVYPDEKSYNVNLCKLFFYCYDSSGAVLNPQDNIFGSLSKTGINTYGSNGATEYSETGTPSLRSSVRLITVSESVKKVRVIISGLTATKVKSVKILSLNGQGSTGNISIFSDNKLYAVEPPNSGSYRKGDIVYHDNSSTILGWIALANGTNNSIWREIPYGKVVSSEGYTLTAAVGNQLIGSPVVGSISSVTVGTTGSSGYPISTGGNAITFGGATFQRTFSIFVPQLSANTVAYIQFYDATGLGLGWKRMNAENATTTTAGLVRQLANLPAGSTVDQLLTELKSKGIMAPDTP